MCVCVCLGSGCLLGSCQCFIHSESKKKSTSQFTFHLVKLLLRLFSSPLSFASRWQEWGHILPDPDTTFPEAALRLNVGVSLSRWFDLFCVYKLFFSIQPFKSPRCFHIVRNQVGLGKAAPKHDPLSIKRKQTHYCGIPPPKKRVPKRNAHHHLS